MASMTFPEGKWEKLTANIRGPVAGSKGNFLGFQVHEECVNVFSSESLDYVIVDSGEGCLDCRGMIQVIEEDVTRKALILMSNGQCGMYPHDGRHVYLMPQDWIKFQTGFPDSFDKLLDMTGENELIAEAKHTTF
ncbi:MAG: hypothetical protein V1807_02535 [Patescibacteria group bacterium]